MGIVTGNVGQVRGGLTGVAADGSGGMVEIYNKAGYKQYSKEELKVINKAAKGDMKANDALTAAGITLRSVSVEEGAKSRNDLFTAGAKMANGDKKKYQAFIKQQNAIGGHHKTFGAQFRDGLLGGLGFGLVGALVGGFKGPSGGNSYDGVQSFAGKDGKLYQVSRTDGKSPTSKDTQLAKKAADGDESAKTECRAKGLMVTTSDPDAALKRTQATPESRAASAPPPMPTMTAGSMGASSGIRV